MSTSYDGKPVKLESLGISAEKRWAAALGQNRGGLFVVCGGKFVNAGKVVRSTARRLAEHGRHLTFFDENMKSDAASAGLSPRHTMAALSTPLQKAVAFGAIGGLPNFARAAVECARSGDVAVASVSTSTAVMSVIHSLTQTLRTSGIDPSSLNEVLRGILIYRSVPLICPRCHGTGVVEGRKCNHPECGGSGVAGHTLVSEGATFENAEDLAAKIAALRAWSVRSAGQNQHVFDFGRVTTKADADADALAAPAPPPRPWPALIDDAIDRMAARHTYYDALCSVFGADDLTRTLAERGLESWALSPPRKGDVEHHTSGTDRSRPSWET